MTVVSSLSSVPSAASSMGSTTFDSPRKRREFPRRPKPLPTRQTTPSSSIASSSKPPRSPTPSKDHGVNPIPRSPHSRPSPKLTPSLQKGSSTSGHPATPRGLPKPPRVGSSISSKTPPRVGSSISSKTPPRTMQKGFAATGESFSQSEVNSVKTRVSKASTASKSSRISGEPNNASSGRTTFQVRLSLGYMTGIKVDQQTKKNKKNKDNSLLVGYASLAKSGKQTALSQPIIPKIGENKPKSVKILWATQKGKAEHVRSSKKKRRIYFSVQLKKEGESDLHLDDSSIESANLFNPEVVKLEVGLKCGNNKFPLGIANLVISGNETVEQKIDLAVRPMTNVPATSHRSRRGIFGSSKKNVEPSVSHDGYVYKLASNSTLRVRVDVKAGKSGQNNTSAWGESDDVSFATNWSYGTMGTTTSIPKGVAQHVVEQTPRVSELSSVSQKSLNGPTSYVTMTRQLSSGDNQSKFKSISSVDIAQAQSESRNLSPRRSFNQRETSNSLPIKYVIFRDSGDAQSLASGLTFPETDFLGSLLFQSCFPLGVCGEDFESSSEDIGQDQGSGRRSRSRVRSRARGAVVQGFSFESALKADALPSWNVDKKKSDSSGTTSETEGDSSKDHPESSRSKLATTTIDRKQMPAGNADLDGASLEGETVDISVDTYTDLKDAQLTLLRYASKVGIEMEDLLEDR